MINWHRFINKRVFYYSMRMLISVILAAEVKEGMRCLAGLPAVLRQPKTVAHVYFREELEFLSLGMFSKTYIKVLE